MGSSLDNQPQASRLRESPGHGTNQETSSKQEVLAVRKGATDRIRADRNPLPGAALTRSSATTRPLDPRSKTLRPQGCQCWGRRLRAKYLAQSGRQNEPSYASGTGSGGAIGAAALLRSPAAAVGWQKGRRKRWQRDARPIRDGLQIGAASRAPDLLEPQRRMPPLGWRDYTA